MYYGANRTPVEVIRGGALGTHFRDIYSGVTGKWYKTSWKEFDQLKNIDRIKYKILSIIARIIMVVVLINMVLNVEHRYDFGKIRVGFHLKLDKFYCIGVIN